MIKERQSKTFCAFVVFKTVYKTSKILEWSNIFEQGGNGRNVSTVEAVTVNEDTNGSNGDEMLVDELLM